MRKNLWTNTLSQPADMITQSASSFISIKSCLLQDKVHSVHVNIRIGVKFCLETSKEITFSLSKMPNYCILSHPIYVKRTV